MVYAELERSTAMAIDLDTFLVALYGIVDDLYQGHFAPKKPIRPGPKLELTDSEVLTLAICAQWSPWSENQFVQYAHRHWHSYFPRLLSQSQTNRRVRDLAGVLIQLVPLVSTLLKAQLAPYEAMDGVPVPLMRACRGVKHRLFGDEASVGKGGSDRNWYYGCHLMLSVTPEGVITGFLLGPANTQSRWMADRLFCWRNYPQASPLERKDLLALNKKTSKGYLGPSGPIGPRDGVGIASNKPYIADGDFDGSIWIGHWANDYQAQVLIPASYKGENGKAARRQHRRWRHIVERVNGALEEALHLPFPLARSRWGLLTRVAAKLVAFNLGIWLNRFFGRPDFAVASLFNP